MQTWRLIDTGSNNGPYNMAVDEAMAIALKEGETPPTLRFYTWNPPCISIGYFQKTESLDTDNITREIVRRPTGGRAVFHGSDLCYSVVSRKDDPLFSHDIRKAYHAISEALVTGLRHLGITADTVNLGYSKPRNKRYHHSPFCFAVTLGHEISINGRKLVGSARRCWSDVFLQHGSIAMAHSIHEVGIRISLAEILGKMPETKAIITALSEGFREALGIDLEEGRLTRYELDLSERLMIEKYSSDSWNRR